MAPTGIGFCVLLAGLSAAGCGGVPRPAYSPLELADFLPAREDVPGAVDAGEILEFDRQNLWINLDGAAEYYLDYGCVRMVTRDYRVQMDSEKGVIVTVKVFDMQSSLSAFGLFSQLRSPGASPVSAGDASALSTSDLIFCQARYFVSVLLFDPAQRTGALLQELAKVVSARLPKGSGLPEALQLLPPQNRLPRTERFIRQNVLGRDFLHHAVAADYQMGTRPLHLYVCQLGDAAAARQALKQFDSTLRERRSFIPPLGDLRAAGTDPFAGFTVLFCQGSYLVLAQGITDLLATRSLLESCSETISRTAPE